MMQFTLRHVKCLNLVMDTLYCAVVEIEYTSVARSGCFTKTFIMGLGR